MTNFKIITLRTIRTSPMPVANTLGRFQIINTMIGTTGQAFVYLLVDDIAPISLPAGFAVALTLHARTVIGTCGIFAVYFLAGFTFPTLFASAGTAYALTVPGAICYPAIRFGNVAFWSFPTFLAMA